jgi:multiple sugar transport system permease protein
VTRRPLWLKAVRGGLLLLITVWSAFPILLVILGSLQPQTMIFQVPPSFWFEPTLQSYRMIFQRWPEFLDGLVNSLIITLGATVLTILVSTLGGYAISRYRTRFATGSAFFMIFVRMFPPIVITLPLFPVVNALGLQDTHLILILLYASFYISLSTWIMKAFIDQIPKELEEAARVDGANLRQTLTRIVLPLSVHGMIAAAVFVFVYSWNEFLFALIFTTSNAKTAPLVISDMLGSATGAEWGAVFAASTLQLIPVLIFVVAAQRYLIAGLTAGSVKG